MNKPIQIIVHDIAMNAFIKKVNQINTKQLYEYFEELLYENYPKMQLPSSYHPLECLHADLIINKTEHESIPLETTISELSEYENIFINIQISQFPLYNFKIDVLLKAGRPPLTSIGIVGLREDDEIKIINNEVMEKVSKKIYAFSSEISVIKTFDDDEMISNMFRPGFANYLPLQITVLRNVSADVKIAEYLSSSSHKIMQVPVSLPCGHTIDFMEQLASNRCPVLACNRRCGLQSIEIQWDLMLKLKNLQQSAMQY